VIPLNRHTSERVSAGLPEPGRSRAARGIEVFEKLPMPDPTEEDWRYVDLDLELDDLGLADEPGEPLPPRDGGDLVDDVAGRAVVVDGHTVRSEGLVPIREASDLPDGIPVDLDRYSAAAHAFGHDGVLLEVPAGSAVTKPYLIDFQATREASISFPRLVVRLHDGAEASLLVDQRSPDGVSLVVVPHIEVVAGADARLSLTLVQDWGDATVSIAQQRMVGGRDVSLGLAEAGLGGAFARFHLTIDLAGRGGDARFLGLYFGDRDQTLDYRAFMNHRAPNTTSDMFLKGAVGDRASSVFTGLIRIEPEGQKTNAHQTNRNLVLSEGAEAHSVPNLEILANDVRCGHGSAVGPLDDEQRYYLMSRGLDRSRADRLQVKGFFEEVLGRFPLQAVEPPLQAQAMAKYAGIVARRNNE
jgi:Fe-S cluster assembly protein SufD